MRSFALVACAVLAACSPVANTTTATASPGRPAYVDLQRAFRTVGYAQELAAYDRDIATLRQSERVRAFDAMPSQFEAAAQNVRERASDARRRAARVTVRNITSLPTSSAPVSSVAPQTGAYRQALDLRAQRAHALRAQQLQEKEATAAFDFERAHEQRRLALQLRLQNRAYIDPSLRAQLQRQLHDIDAQEAAAVDAQRRADAAELARYDATLAQADATEVARMESEAAQHRAAMRSIPAPQTAALPSDITRLHYDATTIGAAFDAAGTRIASRFDELRRTDRGARAVADAEITRLQQQRAALYGQAMTALRARAQRVAAAQHLGQVYFGGAPAGAVDITADL